ncbi:hypothetical protein PHYBOEH_004731 [Phytophthora boehmeriae]|uniref:Uncharacterized protein n=1 Tax=Phytophthora boehmeriae TaxID=109152 RepID=A0A8T1X5T7_9STRA|nr:hypothetical protein PHYBOEH_004731 [Phytophthora boehmeriae]
MQFYREDHRQVLAVLEENSTRSDPYAVRRACAELKRLVLHRNAIRHRMVEEGRLLPVLIEIVANHVGEEQGEVVADCCRFLQRLISHKQPTELDIQSKLTEAGCLGLMTKGLKAQPNARRLYVETCRLVALLCFDAVATPHAENQTDIANAGIYELICGHLEHRSISEEEAAAGCEAVSALVYEHDSNGATAIHKYGILVKFSTLLGMFSESTRVAQSVVQTLFQLLAMEPCLSDGVVDSGMLQQVVDMLDSSSFMQDYRGPESFMVHWHIVKFMEITIRQNDTAKEEFCRGGGPAAVVNALVRRSQEPRHADTTDPWALQYVSCMLLCRVVTVAGDAPNVFVVAAARAQQLVQSSAHQLALDILRNVGVARVADDSEASRASFWAAVAQAVRVLELIATLEANRVPLTRLGASRLVKLVYNNQEVASQPGLLLLCERAVANIEGT